MQQTEYFEKAIAWAEKRGFSQIKADFEDYETPSKFIKQGEDEPYIPNITGMKTGGKCYIEIATKSDNIARHISKWKLLSTVAQVKGGSLFLLTPRGHKSFIKQQVEKYQLQVNLDSI